jgi:hypothetical protein
MLPSIDEAIKELEIAEKLNPDPWVKHSMNVGVAARNIAEKKPDMDPTKCSKDKEQGKTLSGRMGRSASTYGCSILC